MAEVGEVKEMEFEAAAATDPNFEFTEEDEEELKKLESELEEPEEETSEDTEEPQEEPEVKSEPKQTKSDNVPLSKYMQEKKKRQELEKVLRDQQLEKEKAKFYSDFVGRGYPDSEALRLAEDKVDQHREREESRSFRFELEIEKLSKDPFFSDAEAFGDDLKELMQENKKLTARQAYMMLRGEARAREFQTEQEQRNLNKRRKAESKKVVNASPSVPKSPYKLDEDDKKALARLKKAMPEANWSPEKYFKMMKT